MLEGVQTRDAKEVVNTCVHKDELTNFERGMIDRELFPKHKHRGTRRKFIRGVRRRRDKIVCDLIAEDRKLLTIPLEKVLRTNDVGAESITGRARTHVLPETVQERLQELTITADIKAAIIGAIPPSRRKQLERRRARADIRTHHLRDSSARVENASTQEDSSKAAGEGLGSRKTRGDRGQSRHSAEEAGGEGRTRGPKRKADELDNPRKGGKTGGTRRKPEDRSGADRENDLRGRGCGAGGRAEGGGGRGSEVPRRGFPK